MSKIMIPKERRDDGNYTLEEHIHSEEDRQHLEPSEDLSKYVPTTEYSIYGDAGIAQTLLRYSTQMPAVSAIEIAELILATGYYDLTPNGELGKFNEVIRLKAGNNLIYVTASQTKDIETTLLFSDEIFFSELPQKPLNNLLGDNSQEAHEALLDGVSIQRDWQKGYDN